MYSSVIGCSAWYCSSTLHSSNHNLVVVFYAIIPVILHHCWLESSFSVFNSSLHSLILLYFLYPFLSAPFKWIHNAYIMDVFFSRKKCISSNFISPTQSCQKYHQFTKSPCHVPYKKSFTRSTFSASFHSHCTLRTIISRRVKPDRVVQPFF